VAFLEAAGVSKGFLSRRRWVPVIENADLAIERGEFVAIVGFSGSGKSTLISLLAGLSRPDRGAIRMEGRLVASPGPDRAVVFQNYALLPWLSVGENVSLAVDRVFQGQPPEERERRTETFLELVKLRDARHKKPAQLSGGMRQRVAVARALAMDPRVLLLDEPLGALDAMTRSVLQGEIARIWEADRKTVVLITNDVEEGMLLADRIVPLTAGPGATLGPSFPVPFPRPRIRKVLERNPEFKGLRLRIEEFLLISRRERPAAGTSSRLLVEVEQAP